MNTKQIKDGMTRNLLQSGLCQSWWPHAIKHFCFMKNILPAGDQKSAYERRFKDEFEGIRIPVGAKIKYNSISPTEAQTTPAIEEEFQSAIFVGYKLLPGGQWSGSYLAIQRKKPNGTFPDTNRGNIATPTQQAGGNPGSFNQTYQQSVLTIKELPFSEVTMRHIPVYYIKPCIGKIQYFTNAYDTWHAMHRCPRCINALTLTCKDVWQWYNRAIWDPAEREYYGLGYYGRPIPDEEEQAVEEEEIQTTITSVQTIDPEATSATAISFNYYLKRIHTDSKEKKKQRSEPKQKEYKRHEILEFCKTTMDFVLRTPYKCTTTPLTFQQAIKTEGGRNALKKEWEKHEKLLAWDTSKGIEYDDIQTAERTESRTKEIRFGRIFPLCHIQNCQLDPFQQKCEGQLMFTAHPNRYQRDRNGKLADLDAISWTTIEVSLTQAIKLLHVIAKLPGNEGETSSIEGVYSQLKLDENDTWVRIPTYRWPKWWFERKYRDPVCPLNLGILGHPSAEEYKERKCKEALLKCGFHQIKRWTALYKNGTTNLLCAIDIDEIKMAGKALHLNQTWAELRKCLDLKPPEKFTNDYNLATARKKSTTSQSKTRCQAELHRTIVQYTVQNMFVTQMNSPTLDEAQHQYNAKRKSTEQTQQTERTLTHFKQKKETFKRHRGSCQTDLIQLAQLNNVFNTSDTDDAGGAKEDEELSTGSGGPLERHLMLHEFTTLTCPARGVFFSLSSVPTQHPSNTKYSAVTLNQYILTANPLANEHMTANPNNSTSSSGTYLALVGPRAFDPKRRSLTWMCKKQASVSHSSTKDEFMPLRADVRMEGLQTRRPLFQAPKMLYSEHQETEIRDKLTQADHNNQPKHIASNIEDSDSNIT